MSVSDEVLASLVRDLADAVVIADVEGTIIFWNEGASRLFGWPSSHAVGQSLDLIIPERLRERHWTGFREVMATGQTSYGEQLPHCSPRFGIRLEIIFALTLTLSSWRGNGHYRAHHQQSGVVPSDDGKGFTLSWVCI